MVKTFRQPILFAILLYAGMFAAGPAVAGYMDFTAASVQVEETSGC
jgi:hypothetical protein